ncbi:gliding motility-associated ABC transporter substrate-binding protein GldG [Yeosuana aromativorans]|uniref:Gliding motility-associated ABC transporter substrate-binding protein GldG n=1 Tax=Yeosuana aromativorans TaxID=288019 RepID=A0A8J3BQU0_9FLAO|nr:gliding motility-associated ABC transporter substrate-binding protein GldG [Yeosuana aromativorans]GGK32079.1 gliding motility-associated ABC transporter substrate-binding protein GldG [Yeosuana aromativorans]
MKKNSKHIIILIIALIAINYLSSLVFKRFDLTYDKRYTLSQASLNIIKDIDSPIVVDIYLTGNDFPSEFRRLQRETRQLLEEFSAHNSHIIFHFINPLEEDSKGNKNIEELSKRGLTPMQLSVQENGKTSQEVIFPWALASYNGKTVPVSLIKNKIGASQEELVTNSVQHLEYAFADAFSKLTKPKRRKIAILRGNGELDDIHIYDFVKKLGEYYKIAPFTLDSVAKNPDRTLEELKAFDLIITAKPTQAFTEKEKQVLDQYTMNGGKSLWLIDNVIAEKDSLYNDSGKSYAIPRDLNLTDFFFKYGVRVNPLLVSTLYSAPITLALGEGSNSQFQNLRWPYSPLASTNSTHPIVNNLNLVKFDFATQIDTLKNKVKKTILLESAPLSKLEGTPREISLDIVTQEQNPSLFNKGNQTLAVLLEGTFTSVYKNRIKPFDLSAEKDESVPTKMIVISDGDIIKNDVVRNAPQELGFDRWTGKTYGNKEFLLNAVNYLLDDDGLINIRSKQIAVAFLDQQKIAQEKTKWQLVNILLPLVLLLVFGFVFNYIRRKKFSH